MLPQSRWSRSVLGLLTVGVIATLTGGSIAAASPLQLNTSPGNFLFQEFPDGTLDKDLPFGAAWGEGAAGNLGNGAVDDQNQPVLINAGTAIDGKEVSVIAAGSDKSSCGIAEGIAYCWGDNTDGSLGNDNAPTNSTKPVAVLGPFAGKKISAISVGRDHACGVLNGAAYCWGDNSKGQLGNNLAPNDSAVPVKVRQDNGLLAGKTVTAISAGDEHTCVIASGKAFCWGANNGRLGNNSNSQSNVPVAVSTVDGILKNKAVTAISAGGQHTCALADGAAYCWGSNFSGQLGNNNQVGQDQPVAVFVGGDLADRTVTALSAGGNSTCVLAILENSSIRKPFCWGSDQDSALGNGALGTVSAAGPVDLPASLDGVSLSSISVDRFGGCIVAEGKAYCWGLNVSGRLGTGNANTGAIAATAVPVLRPGGVTDKRRFLTITSSGQTNAGVVVTTPSFSDVPGNQAFQDDIKWLAGSGIAQGFADGKFQPGSKISRQAMAAFLFRFKNPGIAVPKCTGQTRKFIDVPATNTQFCGAIEWLVTAKITKVPANGKFNPSGAMLRDTMAAFLFRAHHPNVTDQKCAPGPRLFVDVPATNTQCGNIEWLAKTGVSTGFDGGTYQPKDAVTRASMSAFMHRAAELNAH